MAISSPIVISATGRRGQHRDRGRFLWRGDNAAFGNPILVNNYDPAVLKGWGIRPGDWQVGVTLQQQVVPRVSVEVGYVRRWLQNFYVTDNLLVAPSDFTAFSVVAPTDPRLPGNGGNTISGLYDVNPLLFGKNNNIVTSSANYGTMSSIYNGLELSLNARIRGGLNVQAGSSIGSQVQDSCAVRAQLPELNVTNSPISGGFSFSPLGPSCHVAPGITTRVTGLGSYQHPEGRRPGQRGIHEHSGRPAPGELLLHCRPGDDVHRAGPGRERRPTSRSTSSRLGPSGVTG